MAVYYLGRGDNTSDIQPFPKGLRMLSGDALARSYDQTTMTYLNLRPVADRVSFACLDTSILPETPGMVHTQCKNGLRAQIHFQSCWNGKDLYKSDNSHVAYMSNIDNGVCPPGYPVHMMHLFYEVLYSVANINQDGGRFVFANGDPTGMINFFWLACADPIPKMGVADNDCAGYGFHGDFMNGWDEDVLTAGINACATGDQDGNVKECPAFTPSDISDYATVCPVQPPIVNEPTLGMIDHLPGCITITDGPAEAPLGSIQCASGSQPSSVQSTKRSALSTTGFSTVVISSAKTSSTAKSSKRSIVTTRAVNDGPGDVLEPYAGYVFSGCYKELTGGARALGAASYTDTSSMTVFSCIDFCAKKGFGFAGVEYSQE